LEARPFSMSVRAVEGMGSRGACSVEVRARAMLERKSLSMRRVGAEER
jgi:hypothetical protein